jgi:ubiquinone/menaquinone biosynthesis C-methylase UbiE
MKRSIFYLILIVAAVFPPNASEEKRLTTEQWLEDLEFVVSKLESNHPRAKRMIDRISGGQNQEDIDRLRDREQQPEKVMDAVGLRPGMIVGEAGAGSGYFTFKLSRRVGNNGLVYANDIIPAVLQSVDRKCQTDRITNIRTVLGAEDDPKYPVDNLDMIVVFDCLFEFSQPVTWMRNAAKYLKPGGRLVIVDPDPAKIGSSEDLLSRKKIQEYARQSGYSLLETDDSFLKSHMIVILAAIPGSEVPESSAAPSVEWWGHQRRGGHRFFWSKKSKEYSE